MGDLLLLTTRPLLQISRRYVRPTSLRACSHPQRRAPSRVTNMRRASAKVTRLNRRCAVAATLNPPHQRNCRRFRRSSHRSSGCLIRAGYIAYRPRLAAVARSTGYNRMCSAQPSMAAGRRAVAMRTTRSPPCRHAETQHNTRRSTHASANI